MFLRVINLHCDLRLILYHVRRIQNSYCLFLIYLHTLCQSVLEKDVKSKMAPEAASSGCETYGFFCVGFHSFRSLLSKA